ncbi:SWIM-type domain-containing protein, partial [Aphis craccivora]
PYFEDPINSTIIEIFEIKNLSSQLKYWAISDIKKKMMILHHSGKKIAMPIHTDIININFPMDNQIGWIVVEFVDDESVEVVPNCWLKNNSCAWPKASKQAKKYVQKRIKPNMNDFIFYKSRQIGQKVYSSYSEAKIKLPLAMHKSDLSSADDIDGMTKRKRKYPYYRGQSLSPATNIKSVKLEKVNNSKQIKMSSNSCPPRYQDVSQSVNSNKKKDIFELSDDSNDVSYDSDKDPLWEIDKNQSKSVIDGINYITPEKHGSLLVDKPIDNIKHTISSPVGTWTVEKDGDTQLLYKTSSDGNSIKVKKVLFCEQNIENTGSSGTTANILKQSQDTTILQKQPNISDGMCTI